jgi:subtilisin family serine protease
MPMTCGVEPQAERVFAGCPARQGRFEGEFGMVRISLTWIALLAAAVLLLVATMPATLGARSSPIDPLLLEELAAAPGDTSFLVFLGERADLSAASALKSRAARGQYVYQALSTVANQSQARLRADLDAWGVPYHPFFIVNALRVTGDEALARKLAARPEVDRVVADTSFSGLDDPPPDPQAVDAVQWNISRVNADDVWDLDFTGQSIVVASCDTGVNWQHPALANQYRGSAGNHDYHWYDAFHEYAMPADPHGHGTHTTGTMLGDDGVGNQIGMAPGAQWIACKVNSGGIWKASKYIECWEWFLAPTRVDGSDPDPTKAPHIINNSWSCPGSEGCDPETLYEAVQALYAAGIAVIKSAGNSGPGCATLTVPDYVELLSIGAFDSSDTIASFSSRGPASRDGQTVIKPDIAAPGVDVVSARSSGGYTTMSGTSMAAPHTAGLIALLWSAEPPLIGDLEATYQIVRASAEPQIDLQCLPNAPGGRPNNVWGWGIIDALAAVQAATDIGLGTLQGTVTDSSSSAPLPGVRLEIVQADNGLGRETQTSPSGDYGETLLAATYDLTATLYGYLDGTASGVSVGKDSVTSRDIALDPAPTWALSGTVTELGSDAPLPAVLSLWNTPVSTATSPDTGAYRMDVAEGSYVLRALSPGYEPQERAIAIAGDRIEDFLLQPVDSYYVRDTGDCGGPVYDWIDVSATGTAHSLSDDSSQYVSLDGRQFTFYGNSYSGLYVGSNGYITFGSGSTYPGGNTIPSSFLPNNAIYAFWDDLNPSGGSQGTIHTQLVDGHLFVIQYTAVEHFPSGNPETFEIVLDLDTGAILLQYLEVSDTTWTSVGIENSDGAAGLSYAFHDTTIPTSSLAVAFHPTLGAPPPVAEAGEVAGEVTDGGTGSAIQGATVTVVASTTMELLDFSTDADGAYAAQLCPGWYTMTAAAPGYHPGAQVQIEIGGGDQITQSFELQRVVADLWITKTAPLTAAYGTYLTYTLSFGSTGPDVTPDARAQDQLPGDVVYISSTGGTYSPTLRAVAWEWTDMVSGFADTAAVQVWVSPLANSGEWLCNSAGFLAYGDAAPYDPQPGNNAGDACTLIEKGKVSLYLPISVRDP